MLDTEEKTNNPSMLNAQDQVIIDPRRDNVDQPGSLNAVGYHHSGCLSNAYFSQAHSVYNGGGYDNATSKGVTCLPYANAESLENGSHGIQDESPSVALHGYGYNPQMLHRPYITTQLPSVRGHGHLYHAQQFSASDPSCFQQPIFPKKPCILSSTSVSQGKLPAHIDLQGDSKRFGLKPNYAPSLGSTSKGGDFLGNSDGLDFFHQGSEGCEVGGLWSNWSKPLNGKSSLLQLSSAAASLTPIRSLEFSWDDFEMVNASAQFCGVAEMVGPVDFDKSVDYWLQDKWSGQFPVKWHIIKDVPNSQFRHIILEKNDNKPVTNSRDTQEVELEQGIEMLNIFKNYESYSSILDDFHFYEQRQKAMQERKAGQQANRVAPPSLAVGGEKRNQVSLSNDFMKTMSKSFAEAVLLTEHHKEHSSVRNVVSTAAVAHGN